MKTRNLIMKSLKVVALLSMTLVFANCSKSNNNSNQYARCGYNSGYTNGYYGNSYNNSNCLYNNGYNNGYNNNGYYNNGGYGQSCYGTFGRQNPDGSMSWFQCGIQYNCAGNQMISQSGQMVMCQ